jgi:hypothetical protein
MSPKSLPLLESGGREALKRACRAAKIRIGYIDQLVEAELEQVGRLRKRGLKERFDKILGEITADPDEQNG